MSAASLMLTATGREHFLGGPCAAIGNAPELEDIAHHLAQINRFTGAASRPYSVAEHSMLVERIGAERGASPILRLALLMHDAHEAYTNDLASPSKHAVGIAWTAFESVHAANVRHHFGLRTTFASRRAEIKACDLIALATERRDLTAWRPGDHRPWPVLDQPGAEILPHQARLDPNEPPFSWRMMRDMFISRYLALRALVDATNTAQKVATTWVATT